MNIQRVAALCLALCLILVTGCSQEEIMEAGGTPKWRDSDLNGTIKKDDVFREQDDFAAAANKAWILKNGKNRSSFDDIDDAVYDKKRGVLEDASITGDTAKKLRIYADLAENWEGRDADGVKPLAGYLARIDAIDSREALYDYFCDPQANPLGLAPVMAGGTTRLPGAPTLQVVMLTEPELSLEDPENYFALTEASLEQKLIFEESMDYILSRLGYQKGQIQDLIHGCYRAEKQLASLSATLGEEDLKKNQCTRKELQKAVGDYPLIRYLKAWGYEKNDAFTGNMPQIKKIQSIVEGIRLSDMKAFLKASFLLQTSNYLDGKTFDKLEKIRESRLGEDEEEPQENEGREEDELLFDYYIGSGLMVGPMNELYVEKYVSGKVEKDLTTLTADIIDEFHEVFSQEKWLSKKGKKACIEKLDAMSIHVGRQNYEDVDLTGLTLIPREEGGSFLDAELACRRYLGEIRAMQSGRRFDPAYWDPFDPDLSTTITNAMYSPDYNGIYIFAGIMENPAYDYGMSPEQKLGGIGVIIGHEITHGFDKDGSNYDKDGIEKTWMSTADRNAFEDRSDRVGEYYSTIIPFKSAGPCDGSLVAGEATADMGGLRVTLSMGKDIQGFNYDRYFRSMALLWATQTTKDEEKYLMRADVHPLAFLRVNVGLQQFDEFVKTYQVKKGDGMYLAKPDRIAVW